MTKRRTTKALAARIRVDFLKRRLPIRYWKRVSIIGLTAFGGAALLATTLAGKKSIHAPGSISDAHKMFQNECSACHTEAGGDVTDDGCLECHSPRLHNEQEIRTVRCADCHREHQGPSALVEQIASQDCASCHADLQRKDAHPPEVASGIKSFENGHPEFRFVSEHKDTAAIKLNHKVHLKPDLEGPGDTKKTLQCGDCHAVDRESDFAGRYRSVQPTFEKNCKECHELGFDRQFPEAVVPHEKMEEVQAYLRAFYQGQLEKNPDLFRLEESRTLPGPSRLETKREGAAMSGTEWFEWKIASAEKHLFDKVCMECHVAHPIEPVSWKDHYLQFGCFDHAAHRAVSCASCHVKSMESEETSDLLVPGIANCTSCHQSGGLARDSCFECHTYHGPEPEKSMEGRFPLKRLK